MNKSPSQSEQMNQAKQAYLSNFPNSTWYGRCIFLSWYCDLGTCKFCFRSTIKHKIKHSATARRTTASVLVEALLCRKLGWHIEFLTGGYGIFPFDEIVEISRLVSLVYGKKIWVNLGSLKSEEIEKLRPYVKGIVASIETTEPNLHKKVCPDKSIEPYTKMYQEADGFKKSMTIVIGLGEQREDFEILSKFIEDNKLDRITFYALKPVHGTEYLEGPKTQDYLWWISQTRIRFPKIEIIAGTTARRYEEVGELLNAGANAFTKFPGTKLFGTQKAHVVEEKIKESGREFDSTLTKLPDVDWNAEIDLLDISEELKKDMKEKIANYLSRMGKGAGEDDE